jgi:hypothetical protein
MVRRLGIVTLQERDRGKEQYVTSVGIKKHSPLEGDVTLLDALHIEADGRDGAMTRYQRKGPGLGGDENGGRPILRNDDGLGLAWRSKRKGHQGGKHTRR